MIKLIKINLHRKVLMENIELKKNDFSFQKLKLINIIINIIISNSITFCFHLSIL